MSRCCIDKRNSAELNEAINSMFSWYRASARCYAYLADIACDWDSNASRPIEEDFTTSKWFTRGWTLQELIAPDDLHFYTSDWSPIGNKRGMRTGSAVAARTGIDMSLLFGEASYSDFSVAKRMSWASKRKTSRAEDIAYCLVGLFDVSLTSLYGEGTTRAFHRLQEAIMRTTHDQSLFAWGDLVTQFDDIDTNPSHGRLGLRDPPVWKPDTQPLLGLFADSPADFEHSGDISPVDHGYAHQLNRDFPPTVVNGGVLLNLVIQKSVPCVRFWKDPEMAHHDECEVALLMCSNWGGDGADCLAAIALHPWGDGYHSRTRQLSLVHEIVSQYRFKSRTKQRHIMPFREFRFEPRDIFLRTWDVCLESSGLWRPMTTRGPAWRHRWRERVLRQERVATGNEKVILFYELPNGRSVGIVLHRIGRSGLNEKPGPLCIGVMPPFSAAGHRRSRGSIAIADIQDQDEIKVPAVQEQKVMKDEGDTWSVEVAPDLRLTARSEAMEVRYAYTSGLVYGHPVHHIHVLDLVLEQINGVPGSVAQERRMARPSVSIHGESIYRDVGHRDIVIMDTRPSRRTLVRPD